MFHLCFFSGSETVTVPFTWVLFDQLIPHLLEGMYSHLCCSRECKYYGCDDSILGVGGVEMLTYCRITVSRYNQRKSEIF